MRAVPSGRRKSGKKRGVNGRARFGFITRDDGQADIFVHSTGVVGQSSRDQELYAGDEAPTRRETAGFLNVF